MAKPRLIARDQPAPAARYGLLLTQGTLLTTGLQLANVAVVFPFVCAEEGAYWAAGLLYSSYSLGIVVGYSVTPFVLHRARHFRHMVVAGSTAAIAVLVLVTAVAARTDVLVAFVFLTTSLIIGAASALSKVAFSDLISEKLAGIRRSDLMLTQRAFGALIAIFTTLLLLPLLARRSSDHSHLDVLWLGAAGLAAAAITASLVGPVLSPAVNAAPASFLRTYRESVASMWSHDWFRRYALVQLLFVPVSLGASFFAIYAAANQVDTAGGLLVSSSSPRWDCWPADCVRGRYRTTCTRGCSSCAWCPRPPCRR